MIVTVGLSALAPCDVISVTRRDIGIELSDVAREAMVTSRQFIDELAVQPESVYGVSTGFGSLATRHIPADRRADLHQSLIRSHAAWSGSAVECEYGR